MTYRVDSTPLARKESSNNVNSSDNASVVGGSKTNNKGAAGPPLYIPPIYIPSADIFLLTRPLIHPLTPPIL